MAKLIAVCRDEEYPFDRRQIPLMIEESLTMVMEIPETNISSEFISTAEVSQFFKRYSCLSQSEMNAALMVWQKQLFKLIAVSVPCVGCRRSVERLYNQLWKSGQPAIEPLVIHASGILTLTDSFLSDSKLIYALFYIHGPHLNDVVDLIPKSRRNRRCLLHSLETHKARASGWIDVWDLLSQECRDEVVLIDSDLLLDTLDNYLRKHRFCTECKSKVLKAYNILSGDIEGDTENGYCAALYEGLKSCPKERHIHVVCDTEFIANLIGRAEPELAGGRRERHARTIDIAQEEVLTCLGIHLWERLHRLWQKLRAEEQTWQMLFYLGVEALRKNFETAVEEKQGITQLELVVEEISEAERVKEQRKENKRMKKKKRKENKAKLIQEEEKVEKAVEEEEDEEEKSANSEYSESLDGSEKSSNDSQISPRKTDEEDAISCSPPEESCLTKSPSPKSTSPKCAKKEPPVAPLTTVVENNKPCPPKKESTCDVKESTEKSKCPVDPPKVSCNKKNNANNNKSKCVTKEPVENKAKCSETNNSKPAKCNSKDVVTQQKSCENKDILINKPKPCQPEVVKDTRPWEVVKESKYCPSSDKRRNNNKTDQSNNSSVKPCTENNQKSSSMSSKHVCADAKPPQQQNYHHYQSSSYCKCDEENKPACRRQNGYHDYGNRSSSCGDQKGGKQRNSFPICRSCQPNVGPRFNRHDDQQRYSSTSDVYDKCYSINNARGGNRGKRKGVKQKESFGGNNGGSNGVTTNHHNCSPHHHHNHHHPPSSQQPVRHQHRHSPEDNPAVEDADELRLLKMMGWNAEESTNIAEKDIADFAANRLELETRRQELRDRLRSQFQKMSVNPVRLTGIQL